MMVWDATVARCVGNESVTSAHSYIALEYRYGLQLSLRVGVREGHQFALLRSLC
jgi:hypothetical protein